MAIVQENRADVIMPEVTETKYGALKVKVSAVNEPKVEAEPEKVEAVEEKKPARGRKARKERENG